MIEISGTKNYTFTTLVFLDASQWVKSTNFFKGPVCTIYLYLYSYFHDVTEHEWKHAYE